MHTKLLKTYFFLIATFLIATFTSSAFAYEAVKVARAHDKSAATITVAIEENKEQADCKIYFDKRDSATAFILEQNSSTTAEITVAEETNAAAADIKVAEENIASWADVRVYGTSDLILAAAACPHKR